MPTAREPIYRWPAWMPPPLTDGYTVKPEDRRGRPDFPIRGQFRVEFRTDEAVAACALFLNALQSNWFEAFERGLLRQGTRWFRMDLWVGGQMIEHRVRFRERPQQSGRTGLEYARYTFQLDLFRREGLRKLN